MKSKINELKDKLFSNIHSNNLIYNTCWEDPRTDRKMMKLDADSKVVMITSAGCNALDYVLDKPNEINCIDLNFRQNSLLELKKATILHGDFEKHFDMFGRGCLAHVDEHYRQYLRDVLPEYTYPFWDKKIKCFETAKRGSFYFHGTSGNFAWIFKKYFDTKKKTKALIMDLFDCASLEEQREVYEKLEPKLLNKLVVWMMNLHITTTMLGVPRPQRDLIVEKYPEGMSGYLRDNLRHIFTELPIQDNYFWHLYIKGNYTERNCPEYLREENFGPLQGMMDRVKLNTTSISQFLKDNPGEYTHYVLLDHQDWLAFYQPEALEEEWRLILENSKPGTKILLRSAALEVDFFPEFVKQRVKFSPSEAAESQQNDRVGTYGSTYFGEVLT